MRTATLLLLFGLVIGQSLLAQSAEEVARNAYQHLEAKRYNEAIAAYESLMAQAYSSPDLHYNLGLAYYRNEQLGPAILQLEKAHKLAPYDNKIEKNLDLLRNEQEDGLLPLPTFFLYRWWHNVAARLQPDAWAYLSVILAILGALGFITWLSYRKQATAPGWFKKWRRRLVIAAPIAFILALLFVLFANSRAQSLARVDQAILTSPEVELHATPAADAAVDRLIHEGLRVRVLDSYESWKKIELVDGTNGWIQASDLEVI